MSSGDALIQDFVAGRYRLIETGNPVACPIRAIVAAPSLAGREAALVRAAGLEGRLAVVERRKHPRDHGQAGRGCAAGCALGGSRPSACRRGDGRPVARADPALRCAYRGGLGHAQRSLQVRDAWRRAGLCRVRDRTVDERLCDQHGLDQPGRLQAQPQGACTGRCLLRSRGAGGISQADDPGRARRFGLPRSRPGRLAVLAPPAEHAVFREPLRPAAGRRAEAVRRGAGTADGRSRRHGGAGQHPDPGRSRGHRLRVQPFGLDGRARHQPFHRHVRAAASGLAAWRAGGHRDLDHGAAAGRHAGRSDPAGAGADGVRRGRARGPLRRQGGRCAARRWRPRRSTASGWPPPTPSCRSTGTSGAGCWRGSWCRRSGSRRRWPPPVRRPGPPTSASMRLSTAKPWRTRTRSAIASRSSTWRRRRVGSPRSPRRRARRCRPP